MSAITKDTENVSRYIVLRDSADGTPETGYTITSLDLQYTRSGAAPVAKVDATALAATDSAWDDNKAFEIDGTSSPGLYRVDWPNAAFTTGVDKVILVVSGAGLDPAIEEIELTDFDLQTASAAQTGDSFARIGAAGVELTGVALATDAVDADSLKADAVTAIQSGLATPTNITAGTITTVTTLTGHTAQTGDSFALIGAAGAGLTSLATSLQSGQIYDGVALVLTDTDETIPGLINGLTDFDGTGATLDAAYDAAKTAAQAGDAMDLTEDSIDAYSLSVAAVNAIQSGLSTFDASSDTVDVGKINGSTLAAQVLAASNYEYKDDGVALCADASTDLLRGVALQAAYDAAKILTPGGVEISATNRAAVLLPPGMYNMGAAALTCDTDFVDLIALKPELPASRSHEDVDATAGSGNSLDGYRPSQTVVYTTTADSETVIQSCNVMKISGFTISNLAASGTAESYALYVSASENQGSEYDRMGFWHRRSSYPNTANGWRGCSPVGFDRHVCGMWNDCVSNAMSWRVGRQDSGYAGGDDVFDQQFSATFNRCQGGVYCWIGDYKHQTDDVGTQAASGCRMVDCHAIGQDASGNTGYAFSGCGTFSIKINSDCYFQDCTSGNNSFCMATENAGEFIRCTAGLRSFGGNGGTFSGFATDCIGEDGSFGGAEWMSADGVLSGTLVRCTARGLVAARARPWTLNGATIDNCLFSTAGTTWKDCFLLTDSTSSVTNSTVLVVETGTGIAINSAAAQSVSAVGNRYNNSDNDDDGLGADVTNVGVNTTGATAAEVKTAIEANGSKIDHLWETTEDNGDGVRQFTVDGLENAPSGTGSTPTQMWAYATRTLTEDAAPTASEIWAATSRTLTGGGTVNVSSTVTDDNDIDIVQHDDYLTAYDRQLSWTNSGGDWFGEDLTDAAVAFTAMERDGTVIITKAGAVVTATGTQAVSVDLTAANTALFTKPGKRYKYQLLLTKATYRETEVTGDITVTLTNNEPD